MSQNNCCKPVNSKAVPSRWGQAYSEMSEDDFQRHDEASSVVGIDRLMHSNETYPEGSLSSIYAGMTETEFVACRRQIIDVIRDHGSDEPRECGTCAVDCRFCLDVPQEGIKTWVKVSAIGLLAVVGVGLTLFLL